MQISTLRKILTVLILFLPGFIFADHDKVIEEIDISLNSIAVATLGAIIVFILLVIIRNKILSFINFVSAVVLIVIANGELARYLLTDTVAYLYVMLGFIQIACAVIFGWIYPKESLKSPEVIFPPDETKGVQTHKMVMVVNVIFLLFTLIGIYNAIMVYVWDGFLSSLPYFFVKDIFPVLFLSVATYLFIRKIQLGWILGAAYFICIPVSLIMSRITVIIMLLKHPNIKSTGMSPIYNTITLAIYVICLFLIFSGPVRETFAIKRNQIILASVVGVGLSFLLGYVASLIVAAAISSGEMPF